MWELFTIKNPQATNFTETFSYTLQILSELYHQVFSLAFIHSREKKITSLNYHFHTHNYLSSWLQISLTSCWYNTHLKINIPLKFNLWTLPPHPGPLPVSTVLLSESLMWKPQGHSDFISQNTHIQLNPSTMSASCSLPKSRSHVENHNTLTAPFCLKSLQWLLIVPKKISTTLMKTVNEKSVNLTKKW